ncbi:MAG: flagellar basal body L-ring protein FlgH [Planctomycetaceae bacterium]
MRTLMIMSLLLTVCGLSAQAESLWKKRCPDHAFLFVDSKARRVGDLLTVVVLQDTDVNSQEGRGMGKSTSASNQFNLESETGGGLGTQGGNAALDISNKSSRKFDGSSSFSSNQAFTDRMTVTVMDVLPNGNMVISGQRRVRLAGDERTLVLTGVIRAIDIGPDNTIASRYISELRLLYESAGPEQRFTRQGWLGRATNAIWPF